MIRIYLQELAKGFIMIGIFAGICFITFGSV